MQPIAGFVRPNHMTAFPADRYGLIHRADAIAAAYSDNELHRACKQSLLEKVVRGTYVVPDDRSPEDKHRLLAIAVLLQSAGVAVLSHESAAVMHGLAMLKPDLHRAHLTLPAQAGGRTDSHRHVHAARLAAEEIVIIDGLRVTSLERTAVDVACTSGMGFAGALAVFDAALREGADLTVMMTVLKRRRRGVAQARRALDHADQNSENPGESWGRAQMIEAGLPIPRLQHKFFDGRGKFVARTDYDWGGKLVGEFDGDVKYRKFLRDGETPFDAMKREKQREDDLRRLGVVVIRWTWADLEAGRVVAMVQEWIERLELAAA